ncbi:helix-turn-helix domain-containing protein [Tyzzerella sp. OttesenSCG-928-J15]|nr:helix-turn-helix domain-containing protein [Tyzzerella sp. OttesenSCG-928-J15]
MLEANYARFQFLLEKNKVRTADVAKATGIPASTFTDWKTGRSKPKMEKLNKIAAYFNVSSDYFYSDEPVDEGDLRLLRRATSKMTPEQLKKAVTVLKTMFDEFDWEE